MCTLIIRKGRRTLIQGHPITKSVIWRLRAIPLHIRFEAAATLRVGIPVPVGNMKPILLGKYDIISQPIILCRCLFPPYTH